MVYEMRGGNRQPAQDRQRDTREFKPMAMIVIVANGEMRDAQHGEAGCQHDGRDHGAVASPPRGNRECPDDGGYQHQSGLDPRMSQDGKSKPAD